MSRIFRIIGLVMLLVVVDVSAVKGESPSDSAFIAGFVGHAQNYRIDCEVRSAVDWAAFWGISIGETEFLEALPRSDNPDVGFVGDPNDEWGRIPPYGYGVHADPVAKMLRDYGLKAEAYRDLSWNDLRQEIDAGRPVIVWIIGAMWDGTPVEYVASDGKTSRVAAYEHTMTLVGYTSNTVKVVDSASGHLDTYQLNDFLDSWAVLSNMAVTGGYELASDRDLTARDKRQNLARNADQNGGQNELQNTNQNPDQDINQSQGQGTESNPGQSTSLNSERVTDRNTSLDTYTVQRGDYVLKLARRFGVNWLELAQLNSLRPPYIIYTGQVLRLPTGAAQDTAVPTAGYNPQ